MINGAILLGREERQAAARFHAVALATGQARPQAFSEAGEADVADACALAEAASSWKRRRTRSGRSRTS